MITQYQNGNTFVTIYPDGTKERTYQDTPRPMFPETIDVKITNYCDAACLYCHEQSTVRGKHGDLDVLLDVLSELPKGIELAIGGGNPLDHPDIIPFLQECRRRGWIPNLTVNQKHLAYPSLSETMLYIYGLGVSVTNPETIPRIDTPHLVYHLIAGVNHVKEMDTLITSDDTRILILGYKQFGRGATYYNESVAQNIKEWKMWLSRYFGKCHLSFDNLAIEQLNLRRFFTDNGWGEFYMGDDGMFSMYADAVKQEYAKTSRSKERMPFSALTLQEYFLSQRATPMPVV